MKSTRALFTVLAITVVTLFCLSNASAAAYNSSVTKRVTTERVSTPSTATNLHQDKSVAIRNKSYVKESAPNDPTYRVAGSVPWWWWIVGAIILIVGALCWALAVAAAGSVAALIEIIIGGTIMSLAFSAVLLGVMRAIQNAARRLGIR